MAAPRPAEHTTVRTLVHRLASLGKWIIEPDRLSPGKGGANTETRPPGFFAWLGKREHLPETPSPTSIRERFLSWLVSFESLPDAAATHDHVEGSLLRWLFAGDRFDHPPSHTGDEGGLDS